jgi:eukaryotic-like serine/threonine-protein kinase
MKPERWHQIDKLLDSALKFAPDQWAAFLDEACAADEELRKEVESLLLAHQRAQKAEAFLASPALEVAAQAVAEDQGKSLAGQMFGPFRIVSLLGVGGMGEVYLADDTRLSRKVALKLLPPQFTVNADSVRRFEQEARAASALNHPNIVTIYEIGESNSARFIATEFVDGQTLRDHMASTRMSVAEVLHVARQVASALATAHAAGIVHRDIKPDNIMLRRDRIVKVLDFGLAKLVPNQLAAVDSEGPTRPMVRTSPGIVMGTVKYMSPEQARGEEVDARTDIWSLGVVLYEMLTGSVPFDGRTMSDVLAAILRAEPPALTGSGSEILAELERIVKKALSKDREGRYQGVEDLASDLKSLGKRLEFEAEPRISHEAKRLAGDTHTTTKAEYIIGATRRQKRVTLSVLVALLVTTAAAYFVHSRYFAGSEAGIRSIAVLPFVNAGGDPNMEYLSDGISESLINALSQLPDVKVIGRSSSFRYKGKDSDPQEVANVLGVEAVLMGRVAQRGENLLINVELVNARDKTQVWGEQYNRTAADLLAVQAEISSEIAEKLRLRLTGAQEQRLAKRETTNPQAYDLLLKGRFYLRKTGGMENLQKAADYYNKAIAADPTYAPAYADLAIIYRIMITNNFLDPKEGLPKAEGAALKALELDESLAEAHMAIANLKTGAWDWEAAEREFKRALELNPNLALAHRWYSSYLCDMGRFDEAIAEIKRAQELDPLSINIRVVVGRTYWAARQYDKAIEVLKKTLELDPNYDMTHVFLGYNYDGKGMYPEAIAAYQEAIRLGNGSPLIQINLGATYALAGEREKAQAILKRLERGDTYISPAVLSQLYAALGEREKAWASLERAYAERDIQLQALGYNSYYDSLRTDPHFKDLMRRIGLTP